MSAKCWIVLCLMPIVATAQEPSPKTALGQGKGTLKPYQGPALPKTTSIYDGSDILVFGGTHTVVPAGGVLYVPDAMNDRVVKARPEGTSFQRWPEFYMKNIGWLTVEPLTYQQALGKAPLAEVKWKAIATKEKVVVCTVQGNPANYQGNRPLDMATDKKKTEAITTKPAQAVVPPAPSQSAPPGFPGKSR